MERLREGRREGFRGVPRRLVSLWRAGDEEVEQKGFARVLGEEEGVKKAATEVTAFVCAS